ncbi:MAG: beta strand repeat-containing protein [Alphaproteobacteria bacterium]
MKSVADLIANKNALIKRDKRGKITAASLTAAGAAVLAAAQAEAQGVEGFEDITSSVITFERIGNGQVEFELENGQRFIANEGQYIIDGSEILVSNELVTIVGGAGMSPTVIAVAVAGAALLAGILILALNDDDDDDSTTTPTPTPEPAGNSYSVTSDATTAVTGTTAADTFTVTNQTYSPGLTIDGGSGTDRVTLSGVATESNGIDLSAQNIELTGVEALVVSANGGTTSETVTVDVSGEVSDLTVEATGEGEIAVSKVGVSGATAASVQFNNLDGNQKGTITFSDSVKHGTIGLNSAGTAGSDAAVVSVSGAALTEVTIASNTAANKVEFDAIQAGVTKLNISGSADLDVLTNDIGGTGSADITEIDASNASGDLTFSFATAVDTISLGSGDDKITTSTNFTGPEDIDGGGGNNELIMAAGSDIVAGAELSNFPTLTLKSGTASVDLDAFTDSDLNDINVEGGAITFTNHAGTDIDYTGTSTATISVNGTATSVDVDAPSLTGTLNLTDAGGSLTAADVNFTGAGNDVTVALTDFTDLTVRAGASTEVTITGAALTSVDASNANGGIDFTSTANATVRGSNKADTFNFTGGDAVLDVDALSELGDGFADVPAIGTNIKAAIDAGDIESITGFTALDELDMDGIFGSKVNISLADQVSAADLVASDFGLAADRIDSSDINNAVFMDDTDGGDDYLLIENGGDIYVIEFTGGYTGANAATPTVDDLFL